MTRLIIGLAPLGIVLILAIVDVSWYRRTGDWDALVYLAVLLGIALVYLLIAKPWQGWS